MIKKLVATVAVISGVFLLSGCSSSSNSDTASSSNNQIFSVEYSETHFISGFQILVDNRTGLVYYKDMTPYKGGITPLYGKDKLPMTYEEYKELGYFYK